MIRKHVDARNNRGVVLYKQNKYAEAIGYFDEIIEMNPEYVKAWYNKGVVLGKIGNYLEAINHYDRTLEVKSMWSQSLEQQGSRFGLPGQI